MRNHINLNLNHLLLGSVPMDKDLKRYFISKYRHLVRNNGLDYANAKFKHIEACLKTYRSNGSLPSLGIRTTGWVKKLIHYMDSQPHHVLNFLKGIYTWKGDIDIDKVSRDFHVKLEQLTQTRHPTPQFLREWLRFLRLSQRDLRKQYHINSRHKSSTYYRYCKHHSLGSWMKYWNTWKKRYQKVHTYDIPANVEWPVFPEMYKDFSSLYEVGSQSFERDIVNCLSLLSRRTDIPDAGLSDESLEFLYHNLSDELQHVVDGMRSGNDEDHLSYMSTDFMSGGYVGDIHYIPKQGTGYRPIAVPNRFVQQRLTTLKNLLQVILERLPQDATNDQARFDQAIQSRVTTDSRFIGSVDLSSATEHLPFDWIYPFVRDGILCHPDGDPIAHASLRLFAEVSRASWNNDGYMSKWRVGQPLGTFPSFMWLSLTHHLIAESLSLKLGFDHSPYRILGDDIVIFSKRLHRTYVREMTARDIPLSLSKSFSGKLTEFAGKVFIKKINPFLTPDHSIVSWQSLFDWQYSTGILIPWDKLPKRIKRRITRIFGKLALSGQKCYELGQLVTVPLRGSTCHRMTDKSYDDVLVKYFQLLGEDTIEPDEFKHTGIIFLQEKVLTVSAKHLEMGGFHRRFYQAQLPKWYKDKFRPTTTDNIFSTLREAIREVTEEQEIVLQKA